MRTKQYEISIITPTKVMSEPMPDGWAKGSTPTKVLAIAQPGTSLTVESEWAAKEFMVFKVKTSDGISGYVFSGDGFRKTETK